MWWWIFCGGVVVQLGEIKFNWFIEKNFTKKDTISEIHKDLAAKPKIRWIEIRHFYQTDPLLDISTPTVKAPASTALSQV